jgi:hypothetical protein
LIGRPFIESTVLEETDENKIHRGAFRFGDHCKPDDLVEIAKDYFGDDAKAVIAALLKRGRIIKTKVDAEVAADTGTQAGKQWRIASLTKRFSRADGRV